MGVHPVSDNCPPIKHCSLSRSSPVGLDAYGTQFFPSYDYTTPDQVCGINATNTGHQTGTVKVEAGSTLGFVAIAANYNPGVIPPHPVSALSYVLWHSLT